MDHDQRFKSLIMEFFAPFMELFFHDWFQKLDLSQLDWLDKEQFPDPPEGKRHFVDLLAQVPARDENSASLLLVHIEIESADSTTDIKERLSTYFHFLRAKHQMDIVPLVVYLNVGLDGMGRDTCITTTLGVEVVRFNYWYVGLPALDAIEYIEGDNWIGVALSSLMRLPPERIVELGAEAMRKLAEAPLNEQQRFLLVDCVQAYLPTDEEQRQQLQELMQTSEYQGVQAVNKTVYDEGMEVGREEGMEVGREKGREEGQRIASLKIVCALLEKRLNAIPKELNQHLDKLSHEELQELAIQIATVDSLEELQLPGI